MLYDTDTPTSDTDTITEIDADTLGATAASEITDLGSQTGSVVSEPTEAGNRDPAVLHIAENVRTSFRLEDHASPGQQGRTLPGLARAPGLVTVSGSAPRSNRLTGTSSFLPRRTPPRLRVASERPLMIADPRSVMVIQSPWRQMRG